MQCKKGVQHPACVMRASGAVVDDMVAGVGAASKSVEGDGNGTGCVSEDRLSWDEPADS